MPIKAHPDHELKIVHTVSSGKITYADFENFQMTVWLDPEIYGYNELYDFADSDYSGVEFGELIAIAQKASKQYMLDPNSRFAFLTHTPQHERIAEFYLAAKSMITRPSRTLKSFSSYEDAMVWLTEDKK